MGQKKFNSLSRIQAQEIIASVFIFNGNAQMAIDQVYSQTGVRLSERQVYRYAKESKTVLEEKKEQKIEQNLEEMRLAELRKLAYMEQEVIQQWHRTKQNAETLTVETVGVDENEVNQIKGDLPVRNRFDRDPRDPDPTLKEDLKVQVKTKEKKKISGRAGDPRYIKILVDIQARRAQLIGLDKKDDRQDWREQLRKAGLEETTINAIEYQLTELISKYIAGATNNSNAQSQENGYIS